MRVRLRVLPTTVTVVPMWTEAIPALPNRSADSAITPLKHAFIGSRFSAVAKSNCACNPSTVSYGIISRLLQ